MAFEASAKAAVVVPGKAHAAGQAGGLAKVCNAAWRRDSPFALASKAMARSMLPP